MASNYDYHQQANASNPNLHSNSPYGSGDPYYNASSGYITPQQPKKRMSNWIRFGVPVLIVVIIAAVVGGVVGSRNSNKSSSSSADGAAASGGSNAPQPTGSAAVSQALSVKNAIGVYPTATDSYYMLPIYPATVCEHVFIQVV